jgi:hypothetical protein
LRFSESGAKRPLSAPVSLDLIGKAQGLSHGEHVPPRIAAKASGPLVKVVYAKDRRMRARKFFPSQRNRHWRATAGAR